ncbi:MAG: calcineurin-like phosphoesterase C-terminal domain-containing protein [Alistipes sp.]|nr:calcineurin-like phosphoesterase C-terminal domain-containing protein [Alistipes sp.]
MRKLFLSLILSVVVFVASAAGISNYKELLAFAKAVNKEADISMWQNEKGEVCLTADIDMKKGKKFPTIKVFNGVFDGCGHKLYNWSAQSSLFGTLETKAVVKNLTIDASCNLKVTTSVNDASDYVAYIAKINKGYILNCVNHGSIEHKGEEANKEIMIGAMAACNVNTIHNCKNTGSIICRTDNSNDAGGKGLRLGGLVGTCYNKDVVAGTTISNCENTGNVTFMGDFPNNNIGGIVGEASRSTVKYCVNRGSVVAVGLPYVGKQRPVSRASGITSWSNTDIICCDNLGNIAVSGSHESAAAGICARPNNTLAMVDCVNFGKVLVNSSVSAYAGGIISYTIQPIHVVKCFNFAAVSSEGVDAPSWCAGVCAHIALRKGPKTGVYFRDCANYGNVTNKSKNARSATGGFVAAGSGYTKSPVVPVKVCDCGNFGKVDGNGENSNNMYGWTSAFESRGKYYDDLVRVVKPLKDGTNIFGRVTDSKGAPIVGVVVSDGEQSVKTDVNGEYMMKSDMAKTRFVMISVPAKYEIPMRNSRPQFFRRVPRHINAARADFVLTERKEQSDRFVLAMIGDPQTAGLHSDKAVERLRDVVMPDLKSYMDDSSQDVYAIALGDVVYNKMTSYDDYIDVIDAADVPMFNVIGNHDFDQRTLFETKLGTPYFEAYLAPQNYSFNIGKMHFVVVNNILYNRPTDKHKYKAGLEGYTLKWLENDLKHVSKETTIVICSHAPLMKDATGKYGAKNVNYKKYSALLAEYKNVYAWAGHTHTNYSYDFATAPEKFAAFKNIKSIIAGRCSGQITLNRELNTCGTPNGYMVAEVTGDTMTWFYKTVGHDRNYQIRPYSPTSTNTEYVKANIWNYSPDTWSKPEWWENGVKVADMEIAKGEFDPAYLKIYAEHQEQKLNKWSRAYSKPSKSPNLFRVKPTAGVRSGEIRVTDQFGTTYIQEVKW